MLASVSVQKICSISVSVNSCACCAVPGFRFKYLCVYIFFISRMYPDQPIGFDMIRNYKAIDLDPLDQ
jgi:hypothetical protein